MRYFLPAPVLAVLAGLLVVLLPSAAHAADRDCSDFATQRGAQRFFQDHNPSADPHRLDADGDGIACESNKCPCLYSTRSAGGGAAARTQRARVTRVVDGDTIDVRLATGRVRRVRLVGIDTPEVYGAVECGGPAASRSLKGLLPRGIAVRLVTDPTQAAKDRYGRLLRYVHKAASGRDVNRAQVSRGWARVYVYGGRPFRRVELYRRAQATAKGAGRGRWGAC